MPVPSTSYTIDSSAHRAGNISHATIEDRRRLYNPPKRHPFTVAASPAAAPSLDDTAQYQPPPSPPPTATMPGSYGVDVDIVAEENAKIRHLQEFGLSRAQAEINLRKARGDVNEAANLAMDDWETPVAAEGGDDVSPSPNHHQRPPPAAPPDPANEHRRSRRRSRSRSRLSLSSITKRL
jgi:hypothetical protein